MPCALYRPNFVNQESMIQAPVGAHKTELAGPLLLPAPAVLVTTGTEGSNPSLSALSTNGSQTWSSGSELLLLERPLLGPIPELVIRSGHSP